MIGSNSKRAEDGKHQRDAAELNRGLKLFFMRRILAPAFHALRLTETFAGRTTMLTLCFVRYKTRLLII